MPDGKNHRRTARRPLLGVLCLLLLVLLSSVVLILTIKGNGENNIAQSHPYTSTPATTAPTLTPSATASAPVPTPTPFFFDNFADNSNAWTISQDNDTSGYLRLLHNNQLILKDTNHQILVEALPTNATYNEFILTTTFTFVEGDNNDSIGLYLRGNPRLDRDYRIDIFGNNAFSITKEFLTPDNKPQAMTLQEPTICQLLKPVGDQNTLTIMMKGPYLLVMLNGGIAASIIDADYTQGQIALFVRNGATSNGVEVAFNTIEVKAVPQPATDNGTATPTATTTATTTAKP